MSVTREARTLSERDQGRYIEGTDAAGDDFAGIIDACTTIPFGDEEVVLVYVGEDDDSEWSTPLLLKLDQVVTTTGTTWKEGDS